MSIIKHSINAIRSFASRVHLGVAAFALVLLGLSAQPSHAFTGFSSDSAWVDTVISYGKSRISWALYAVITIVLALVLYSVAVWAVKQVRRLFGR